MFWDSYLLVSLTLWDTPVLFMPPLPLPQENGSFVRGGMVFSRVRARIKFFDLRVLWGGFSLCALFGRPQMWERVQVGFGSTGKKRKGTCTKQCAWRKHGSCDTLLAEACPPKLWNTVKYRVEKMRPKWRFWKHCAPKMRLVEAQRAYRKHCYPETPLGSPPTSGVSQPFRSLQILEQRQGHRGSCVDIPRGCRWQNFCLREAQIWLELSISKNTWHGRWGQGQAASTQGSRQVCVSRRPKS